MNKNDPVAILRGEIARSVTVLERVYDYFVAFQKRKLGASRTTDEAMVVAQTLSNYYTCAETLFLRISQFFENGLDSQKWHLSLLDKMLLEIPGHRPAVISESIHQRLLELLKFRHFTRYYFELDYDWDKLDYLIKKCNEVHPALLAELRDFDNTYLQKLLEQ